MNIAIRSYLAGSFLLEQEPDRWDAIVILDSGLTQTDFVAEHATDHIYLRFDDISSTSTGKRLTTSDDVRAALEFSSESENLMVCCRAGQSLSAAIAFLVACQRFGSKTAGRVLNAKKHSPNSFIVELGAELTDDPDALQAFTDWQQEFKHINLTDRVDTLEREFEQLERRGARNLIVNALRK